MTPTFSQPFFNSPSPSQNDLPSPFQDLEPSPSSPAPTPQRLPSLPPSQHVQLQQTRSVSQPPMGGNMSIMRNSRQVQKRPTATVDEFLASMSVKPRLKRNRGADDVYEMIETVIRYFNPTCTTCFAAEINIVTTQDSRPRGMRPIPVTGSYG